MEQQDTVKRTSIKKPRKKILAPVVVDRASSFTVLPSEREQSTALALSKREQPENLSAGLALIDEATKLLDVSAKIAERLNTLGMVDHVVTTSSSMTGGSSRQRAAKLSERMTKFRRIYNAAWMVRHYQHASGQPLKKAISEFCTALALELESAKDQEALIYAVAHSLTLSPYGMPWES